MRRLSLSFLLLPLLGFSQEPANSLLWRVQGNGLIRPSYVVGTVHSRDARAFGQVPQLLEIITQVDAVAGELDLTGPMGNPAELAVAMMMPPGQELSDLYPRKKLKVVQDRVQQELGAVALLTGRMKPFYLMAMLGEATMREDSALVLDQYLEEKAKAMGKGVLGLETIQEQLAAVDALPLQEQANMLYDLVEHDLYRRELEGMLDAYAAQDLDSLTRICAMGGMPDVFNARLLSDRNKVMAQRMDSLLQNGSTLLFAVGAAHLTGVQGLLMTLRTKGYRVDAVTGPLPGPVGLRGE
jgi:uncharacterized protein YbaP (TraB family)